MRYEALLTSEGLSLEASFTEADPLRFLVPVAQDASILKET